eukprot:TRINITY_DN1193_c0_g4_i3.p1 TRINITY_DN1193_c0_g4~~TRINITY_DN1193_c0_g4_i3.p1  ORF type:complete len:833 (-),score=114.29 TRINITY_DN1193_c0_g4_i3:306-2552(-)
MVKISGHLPLEPIFHSFQSGDKFITIFRPNLSPITATTIFRLSMINNNFTQMRSENITFNIMKLCPAGVDKTDQLQSDRSIFLVCSLTFDLVYLSEATSIWKKVIHKPTDNTQESSCEFITEGIGSALYMPDNKTLSFAFLKQCKNRKEESTWLNRFYITSDENSTEANYQLNFIESSPVRLKAFPSNLQRCGNENLIVFHGDYDYMDGVPLSQDELVAYTPSVGKQIIKLNTTYPVRRFLRCGNTIDQDGSLRFFVHKPHGVIIVITITSVTDVRVDELRDPFFLTSDCSIMTHYQTNLYLYCTSFYNNSFGVFVIQSQLTTQKSFVILELNPLSHGSAILADSDYIYIGGNLATEAAPSLLSVISIATKQEVFSVKDYGTVNSILKVKDEVWIGGKFDHQLTFEPVSTAQNLLRVNTQNWSVTPMTECLIEQEITMMQYDSVSDTLFIKTEFANDEAFSCAYWTDVTCSRLVMCNSKKGSFVQTLRDVKGFNLMGKAEVEDDTIGLLLIFGAVLIAFIVLISLIAYLSYESRVVKKHLIDIPLLEAFSLDAICHYLDEFDINTFAIDKIKFHQVLGVGAQGEVRRIEISGKFFAGKSIFSHLDEFSLKSFVKELSILRSLDHPNIVKFHGVVVDNEEAKIWMISELMECSLKHVLGTLTTESKYRVTREIAKGMRYLHSFIPPILHRDLKPANILVNSCGTVKITDFGVSDQLKDSTQTFVGSFRYIPPVCILDFTLACNMFDFFD